MKRILIFSHAMELGGAERALIGLLHSFDYTEYQVDLFLMGHRGELMQYIPKEVNLLPEIPAYTCLAVPIGDVLRKKQFDVALGRALGKLLAACYARRHGLKPDHGVGLEYSHKYTRLFMPRINDTVYDLSISFLTPHYFAAEKVTAKKKIAWIHTDYSYVDIDVKSEARMWGAYDYIASISEDCTRGFLSRFPGLAEKIVRIDNILPVELVRAQAEELDAEVEMPRDGSIRLLSVGRFCNAKNFDNVPDICRRINDIMDTPVKWYLIGFGSDEDLIRQRIKEAHMEDHVIILGKKSNPYPYMNACDLYVQPSRYEGNCVCVHEAQALGKSVVITNYATAASQLQDGVDGVIVPLDNEGCASGIAAVLREDACCEKK